MSAQPMAGVVALVTGAGGGLGGAIAAELSRAGAAVALHYRASGERVERTVGSLTAAGGEASAYRADLAVEAECERLADRVVADWGRLDVLVNGAGTALVKPALETSVTEWREIIDGNLTSAFLCTRAAGTRMVAAGTGGSVVNLASVAAVLGLRARAAYCAAKAGLVGLTRALAAEWACHGIRVNAVAPGVVATDAVNSALEEGRSVADDVLARTPLGRLAAPTEVAAAVRFLASSDASYVTGQCIAIDGGWSASAGDALRTPTEAGGGEQGSSNRSSGNRPPKGAPT